ncbi:Prolyl-tRNA synthetase [Gluconacetobacter sp. SXCC-1]|uniref:Proline--tRNA ligase n=1 Tax=Komagataeibacter rhaeticus TaxID=215221 RepID=A0A181CBX0_9PROT|nr:proline--tRNA ligase [Komagataeibacter rhaeticus]ATU72090.1 proline--tRNA ligase [Komagataeibacter xylinus]EGG75531.1 Prolyl-tRNA synthetase [Gluconacetobacter sp. SXCC-1]QIP35781.1 proline--tRNA ligase [Komagataeibacter rhaeticus]QOC45540.1 proline--tRNA ligase [Komagataeibacter rhaeticus]WPP21795.1 proline--tRNA ligase [Komagataeibacter rhaeticus]
MRLSRSFLPTLKENPTEAQITSHRLMLRAGMIRQTAAGIYAWLPTGLRVLRNIANIVRAEQDAIGAQELLMPTMQSAELWKRSGRYDAYGPEMLRIQDRHERDMLFGPTNEEMVTDLFGQAIKSYKELPQVLYQIQWKFRDEVRPRFGVMRGREFYMKDAYSFDLDHAAAVDTYRRMMLSYLRTFQRLGVRAIPMRADTGPIGGELSHEFLILAPTGESGVFFDSALEEQDWVGETIDVNDRDALGAFFTSLTSFYAATDEMHDEAAWAKVPAERRREGRGIEVGHIFNFGRKYTQSMDIAVSGPDGAPLHPEMGSYGIGVSRLVAAIIEASHDENGIIWPESVAPFRAVIINLKNGDAQCDAICEKLYAAAPDDLLYDDRAERAGAKFADADLLGHPWQLIVGPRGAKEGKVEVKNRRTGERTEETVDAALALIMKTGR